jgi:hypothetical protein
MFIFVALLVVVLLGVWLHQFFIPVLRVLFSTKPR